MVFVQTSFTEKWTVRNRTVHLTLYRIYYILCFFIFSSKISVIILRSSSLSFSGRVPSHFATAYKSGNWLAIRSMVLLASFPYQKRNFISEVPSQCRQPGSNRHGNFFPRDFKSRASANSAMPAVTVSNCSTDMKFVFANKNDPDETRTRDLRRDRAAL